ncbi:putative mitochondrial carrier domain superfamily [Helianthus anomalus]
MEQTNCPTSPPSFLPYAPLAAGSLACITCYPLELARSRMQKKHPWKSQLTATTLVHHMIPPISASHSNIYSYASLWTGLGAQLARESCSFLCNLLARLPLSQPLSSSISYLVFYNLKVKPIIIFNFCFLCQVRRQKHRSCDYLQCWLCCRDGGVRGLFMGVGPRVGRAGPSVAIVVSSYEVKYVLQNRKTSQP